MPDTSVMVPAVSAWHDSHERARCDLERRLEAGEQLVLAAHALVETFAVLTRLPPPHRISARDALALIEANYAANSDIIALSAEAYLELLRGAPDDGIAGGRIYDRVIAWCAVQARVTTFLTFNVRDFAKFATDTLAVAMPE